MSKSTSIYIAHIHSIFQKNMLEVLFVAVVVVLVFFVAWVALFVCLIA